jgi:hypothetical protein
MNLFPFVRRFILAIYKAPVWPWIYFSAAFHFLARSYGRTDRICHLGAFLFVLGVICLGWLG